MRPLLILVATLTGTGLGAAAGGAKAEDASWGCQVLLCAASKNPSWHGVAYCVPPMTKLIAAMKEPGFSWPICHEANAGKPGRENYEDCPAGTTVGYSSQGDGGWRGEPDRCTKNGRCLPFTDQAQCQCEAVRYDDRAQFRKWS